MEYQRVCSLKTSTMCCELGANHLEQQGELLKELMRMRAVQFNEH